MGRADRIDRLILILALTYWLLAGLGLWTRERYRPGDESDLRPVAATAPGVYIERECGRRVMPVSEGALTLVRSGKVRLAAVGIVAGGVVVRVLLMPIDGHRGDLEMFRVWSSTLKQAGIAEVYHRGELPPHDPRKIMPCNYPPLYLYALAGAAWTAQRLGVLTDYDKPHRPGGLDKRPDVLFVLKTPALIADVLACWLLFWFWSRRGRPKAGLVAMAAYAFCPPVLFDGACWGQSDTVLAAVFCVVVIAALEEMGWLCGLAVAAAILLKPQGLLALPIWLAIVLAKRRHRRSLGALRRRRLGGFAMQTVASAALVAGMVVWPVARGAALGSLWNVYRESVGHHTSVTVLAFNAWYIWSGPGVYEQDNLRRTDDRTQVLGPISYRYLGLAAFMTVCLLVLGIATRSQARPEEMPVLALAILWAFFMLNTEMHERYGVPAMIFLAMCLPLSMRFAAMYGLLSITNLWNLSLVFVYPSPWPWLRRVMVWPKLWVYSELGFILAVLNCLVLLWCLEWLLRRTGYVKARYDYSHKSIARGI